MALYSKTIYTRYLKKDVMCGALSLLKAKPDSRNQFNVGKK